MKKMNVSTIVLLFITTLLIGCSARLEESTCTLGNMLIENSAFPNDIWKETGSRDIEGAPSRVGIDRAGTSFSTQNQGGSVQHIYRFSTAEDANINYVILQRDWINLVAEGNNLSIPDELSVIDLVADEYLLGCTHNEIETCLFVALYEKDVVEFMVDMPSLTYDDLVKLLIDIDSRMQSCK